MDPAFVGRLKMADDDTVREIMREAELHLNAQLTAAIAADQRANAVAGFLAATGAVLVGAAYSLIGASSPSWYLGSLATFVGILLIAAAAMAVYSARPIDFEFAGSRPGAWKDDLDVGKPLAQSMAEQCGHYDGMIVTNREAMEVNGKWFERARRTVMLALVSGGVGFVGFLMATAHKALVI